MTAEESEVYNRNFVDIETFVQEYTINIMFGNRSLDDSYDEFVARLKDMGIEDCIAAQQAALNRYNSR